MLIGNGVVNREINRAAGKRIPGGAGVGGNALVNIRDKTALLR